MNSSRNQGQQSTPSSLKVVTAYFARHSDKDLYWNRVRQLVLNLKTDEEVKIYLEEMSTGLLIDTYVSLKMCVAEHKKVMPVLEQLSEVMLSRLSVNMYLGKIARAREIMSTLLHAELVKRDMNGQLENLVEKDEQRTAKYKRDFAQLSV